MLEFFHAVRELPLLRLSLWACLLASLACGVVGSYVVVRRISYMAGGIAHCVLGGLGAALYLNIEHGWTWLQPLHGAVVAALLAAVIIAVVSLRGHQREDTVIGAMWAVGMAVGLILMREIQGRPVDPMSYLFGDILLLSTRDLWLLGGLDVLVMGFGVLFYNQLQAVCFDDEFARLRGVRVDVYYILLLCLTALTVVLLVYVVGIVMVIALLTLPVAIAGHFCRTLWQMMLGAVLLSMLFTTSGLALSYEPELPPGATIIVLAGGAYFLVLILARIRWPRRATRPARQQL